MCETSPFRIMVGFCIVIILVKLVAWGDAVDGAAVQEQAVDVEDVGVFVRQLIELLPSAKVVNVSLCCFREQIRMKSNEFTLWTNKKKEDVGPESVIDGVSTVQKWR